MNRRIGLVFLIVILTAFYIAGQIMINRRYKMTSTTAFSRAATGVSIFSELAQRRESGDLEIKRSPLLDDEALEDVDTLMLFGPRQPVSNREALIIAKYVNGGGNLVVSFESEMTMIALEKVFGALGVTVPVEDDPEFINRKLRVITPNKDSPLFSAKEKYAVYSRQRLTGGACSTDRFSCFVQEHKIGTGSVSIWSGVPFVANALIGHEDNRRLAWKLMAPGQYLIIDEHGHFFSERTLKDLFLTPAFILPILGLVFGALAFFLYCDTSNLDRQAALQQQRPAALYHDLNSSILQGLIANSGLQQQSLLRQKQFLTRLFPERAGEIESTMNRFRLDAQTPQPEMQQAGRALVALHKRFIQERRILVQESVSRKVNY